MFNSVDEMDVDATISSSHNRRTVNMQIDTNEPGRVIGLPRKSLEGSSTFGAKLPL